MIYNPDLSGFLATLSDSQTQTKPLFKKQYIMLPMKLIQSCVHKGLTRRGLQRCISVLLFKLNVKPSASEEKGPFTTCSTPP